MKVLNFAIHATMMAVNPRPFAVDVEMVCAEPLTRMNPAIPQIAPEIAMVRSAYRGNGLQKELMEAAEEQLRSAGFRWLMGTAHPDNVYSVHNFEQLGYKLVTKALKYGGLPRYIFCKKI